MYSTSHQPILKCRVFYSQLEHMNLVVICTHPIQRLEEFTFLMQCHLKSTYHSLSRQIQHKQLTLPAHLIVKVYRKLNPRYNICNITCPSHSSWSYSLHFSKNKSTVKVFLFVGTNVRDLRENDQFLNSWILGFDNSTLQTNEKWKILFSLETKFLWFTKPI